MKKILTVLGCAALTLFTDCLLATAPLPSSNFMNLSETPIEPNPSPFLGFSEVIFQDIPGSSQGMKIQFAKPSGDEPPREVIISFGLSKPEGRRPSHIGIGITSWSESGVSEQDQKKMLVYALRHMARYASAQKLPIYSFDIRQKTESFFYQAYIEAGFQEEAGSAKARRGGTPKVNMVYKQDEIEDVLQKITAVFSSKKTSTTSSEKKDSKSSSTLSSSQVSRQSQKKRWRKKSKGKKSPQQEQNSEASSQRTEDTSKG